MSAPGEHHMLLAGQTDRCVEATGSPARCEEMREWLRSAGRAFLDAHLRRDPAAADFLASAALVQGSGGVIEWERK